jgi:hypothetical protein
MGMAITSITSRVLKAVDPRYIGSASGVLATVLQVGGAQLLMAGLAQLLPRLAASR